MNKRLIDSFSVAFVRDQTKRKCLLCDDEEPNEKTRKTFR
jgi:hypothetical protein